MTTLYELADTRLEIAQALEASEGELTPELEAALDAVEGAFNEKVERVALFIRDTMGRADLCKAEEERLATRRRRFVTEAESLKAYLKLQMEKVGKEKVVGDLVTVSLGSNPPSVVGDPTDEQMRMVRHVRPDWITTFPERLGLNRRAILDAAKAGIPMVDLASLAPGVTIDRTMSVRIR